MSHNFVYFFNMIKRSKQKSEISNLKMFSIIQKCFILCSIIVKLRQSLIKIIGGHISDSYSRTITTQQGDHYFLTVLHVEQINYFAVHLAFFLSTCDLLKSTHQEPTQLLKLYFTMTFYQIMLK